MITITPVVSFHVWRKGHTYQVEDTPSIRAAIAKGRLRQVDAPVTPVADTPALVVPDTSETPPETHTTGMSRTELMRLTRAELVAIVEDLDVWTPDSATKADLADAILTVEPLT